MILTETQTTVAVIVPCHNHGLYLGECLQSVINQSFTDWVCVIINDGSSDDSVRIAESFVKRDSRFCYLHQRKRGVSAARNFGIQSCRSEFILPLDADDIIHPAFLERTLLEADQNPKSMIVYTDCHLFGAVEGRFVLPDYNYNLELRRNLITATALYRREDYIKTSGYDEKLTVGWEDWEFWISLLTPDSIVKKVDEPLFEYRQKEKSRNKSLSGEQMSKIRRYIYYKHIDKYNQRLDDSEILTYKIKILEQELREIREKKILNRLKRKFLT